MVSVVGLLNTERTFGFVSLQCSFIVFRVFDVEPVGVDSDGGGGGGAMESPSGGGGGGIMNAAGGGGVGTVLDGTLHEADGLVLEESSTDIKSVKSTSRIFSWFR